MGVAAAEEERDASACMRRHHSSILAPVGVAAQVEAKSKVCTRFIIQYVSFKR